jgi:large subunit ribosomal protein L6
MSNIGKQRILIPKNVIVKCKGWKLTAIGAKSTAFIKFPHHTQLILKDNYLKILNPYIASSLYGSYQRKLKALIYGLSLEYVVNLKLVGVGFRATIEKSQITLRLGFSHEISLEIPTNIEVVVFKRSNLKLSGSNLEELHQFAYKLRSYKRPEPFKGKGIVILGEVIRRKEGKKKKS